MSASVVALDDFDRFRRVHARTETPASVSDVIFGHFRAGREQSAELAAQLALQSGHSLAQLYDRLRNAIYLADREDSDSRAVSTRELDERLATFVARLQPPATRHRDPQAMVLSTVRRGVAACICHLFNAQGVPATTLELAFLANHRRDGAGIPRQFPAVRYIVVDGGAAKSQELVHISVVLGQLHLLSGHFNVVVLGDDSAAIEAAALYRVDHLVYARSLSELMAAAGVPAESPLTERERSVLEYIADGATNQQAASAMGISIATVKTYLERAQAKLKTCDRASTVAAALRRGWL